MFLHIQLADSVRVYVRLHSSKYSFCEVQVQEMQVELHDMKT